MGQKDTLLKRYFSDEARFADLINGVIGAGKRLITAENVTDMDSQVGIRVPEITMESRGIVPVNHDKKNYKRIKPKYRDLVRKIALGMNFIVVGVEEQEHTHYLMPVRCMGYVSHGYQAGI